MVYAAKSSKISKSYSSANNFYHKSSELPKMNIYILFVQTKRENCTHLTVEDNDMTDIDGLFKVNQDPGWLCVSLSRVHGIHWLWVELQVF